MFKPHLEAPEGFPVDIKMKADTKLTVVMCCQIVDKRFAAPSSGRFGRWPAPPQAAD